MSDRKLNLKDLQLKHKRVLMRVDVNVPLAHGVIEDDSRILAAIPSIEYIVKQGASLILMSHLGRPQGKPDPAASLTPIAIRLSEILKKPVQMAKDCVGSEVEKIAHALKPGEILLLENLRFHPGEENPLEEPHFVQELAKLGDVYVNDAFGTAHRAHASTVLITQYFPKQSAMGFLMETEIQKLSFLLKNPPKPFYAIVGGAKASSKIGVLKKLATLVDSVLVGGAMAFPFLKAQGVSLGASLSEDLNTVASLPKDQLVLPVDLVVANAFSNDARVQTLSIADGIPEGWYGMDIGPKTVIQWTGLLKDAKTVFWNGPLGVYEMPHFAKGTQAIASFLATLKAKTCVGGGNSIAALKQMGLADQFYHLSTGGGASLEFLEFGHLPGIDALTTAL